MNPMEREAVAAEDSRHWMVRLAEEFKNGGNPDPTRCSCYGSGWITSPLDTHSECPYHYRGQSHLEYVDGSEDGREYTLVEHILDHPSEPSMVFQILDDLLVNVYYPGSGFPIVRKMGIEKARELWRKYVADGYFNPAKRMLNQQG